MSHPAYAISPHRLDLDLLGQTADDAKATAEQAAVDIAALTDRLNGQATRTFAEFGPLGRGDDTQTIQAAIDWSSANKGIITGVGAYFVTGLIVRDATRMRCPSIQATSFTPVSGSTDPVFALDEGPVQNVELSGFSILDGGNAGQHAIYFHAVPTLVDAVMQGGLWYSEFRDIEIRDFTGESLWLHGGDDSHEGPHQFLKFASVRAFSAATAASALRLSGQVGQCDFDGACQFDGPGVGVGTVNVLLERTCDVGGVNDGDVAPYSINFDGVTVQSNTRMVTIERALSVNLRGCYFEACEQGIYNDISAQQTLVEGCAFANCGTDGGGTGWAVKVNGGILVARNNAFIGTCDQHYVCNAGATSELRLEGGDYTSGALVTSGITFQVATAATIDVAGYDTVFVNGGSATAITTLTSTHLPGDYLTLVANGGQVIFATGGNLDLASRFSPLNLPSGAAATFQRNDLSGVWRLVAVSGVSGHQRPLPLFKSANYAAAPNDGTIRVDATGGNKTITLPSVSLLAGGERITVKKIDGTTNTVSVSGATGGEDPDGSGDAVLRYGGEEMDFEHNATAGSGGWDIVGHYRPIPTDIAVSGDRKDGSALASLLSALGNQHWATDSTTNSPLFTVTGSRANTEQALKNLLSLFAAAGFLVDSTTA